MQKVIGDKMLERALALLGSGEVDRVLAWKKGQFGYDVTPYVFTDAESLKKDFVYGVFSGANLSKYLVRETVKDGKVLVFLKPCDSYSFNQLLTEHRFAREKVYAIGVPCDGTADAEKLKAAAGDGIVSAEYEGDTVTVGTLYESGIRIALNDVLCERCKVCKSKKCVAYDELIGDEGDIVESARFDEVERLEAMSEDERYEFWQGELSRCIRCNACRDICPACTCEKCVFDNPASPLENKAPSDSFEEKMFHIIRAFHVAGRCTDCGECSRVCPQNIPLHLLNRKFIKDINDFYGSYQAGAEVGSRAPLVNYEVSDLEPGEAVRKGDNDA